MLKASLVAQMVKSLLAMQETRVQCLGWEDPLEKEIATHSSILVWKIPWTAACQTSPSLTISQSAQVHVHWIGDAIQLSHPLTPSLSALSLSQHQGLFDESAVRIR